MSDAMDDAEQDGTREENGPLLKVSADVARGTGRVGWARDAFRRRPWAVLAVVVIIALVCGGGAWWMNRGLPDDVAVRIGDTDISTGEVKDWTATMEALYGVEVPTDKNVRDKFWRDAAQSVVMARVIADAAKDQKITVNKAEVDRSLEAFITNYFGMGKKGRAGFEKSLGEVGTSEKEVRDEVRRQLVLSALYAKVTNKVTTPTDGEVERAYAERKCSLKVPQLRKISNVVVASKREANSVLRTLRSGTPFGTVAANTSIDGSTSKKGGDLGFVGAADLADDYAKAAFEAKKGQLFGPVRTEHGWNIGKVVAIKSARVPKFGEVRDALRQTLFAEEQGELWRGWLEDRLKKADIEYNDKYRPKDPLALPSAAMPKGVTAKDSASADC